ncbi:hypothetical protein CAEBREN_21637 [Caenorhabditis brenneri]|uniref:Uncharacterized protein n=1 Tax=Caenorhabditis brenneri TaxID=135651 RepID=G0MQ32_CAEBE|nr:hypothetical protein CAEBREN_21637 [Caenorhabditis brenneri]
MFDEGIFRYHLKMVEESRTHPEFVIKSLHSLREMNIPFRYTEEVVKIVEQNLRKDGFWRPAMRLIRKLEHRKKYPCLKNYARKLPDSLMMEQMWRKARLQQMRDRKRIDKALGASCSSDDSSEEEEEEPLPDVLEEGEILENEVLVEQTVTIFSDEIPKSKTPDFQSFAEFKKKKKKKKGKQVNKHKKRTRKRHYANSK